MISSIIGPLFPAWAGCFRKDSVVGYVRWYSGETAKDYGLIFNIEIATKIWRRLWEL